MVRTDSQSQTLRKFFKSKSTSSPIGSFENVIENEVDNTTANENDPLKHTNNDKAKNNKITNLSRIDQEPIVNER